MEQSKLFWLIRRLQYIRENNPHMVCAAAIGQVSSLHEGRASSSDSFPLMDEFFGVGFSQRFLSEKAAKECTTDDANRSTISRRGSQWIEAVRDGTIPQQVTVSSPSGNTTLQISSELYEPFNMPAATCVQEDGSPPPATPHRFRLTCSTVVTDGQDGNTRLLVVHSQIFLLDCLQQVLTEEIGSFVDPMDFIQLQRSKVAAASASPRIERRDTTIFFPSETGPDPIRQ